MDEGHGVEGNVADLSVFLEVQEVGPDQHIGCELPIIRQQALASGVQTRLDLDLDRGDGAADLTQEVDLRFPSGASPVVQGIFLGERAHFTPE